MKGHQHLLEIQHWVFEKSMGLIKTHLGLTPDSESDISL